MRGSFTRVLVAVLLAWAMVPGAGGSALAATWYVNGAAGTDTNSCLTPAACRSIGAAIGKAANGDTINVAVGTYAERLGISKSLTLAGAGQASVALAGGNSWTPLTVEG